VWLWACCVWGRKKGWSRGGVKPPARDCYKLHLVAVFDGEVALTGPSREAWTKATGLKFEE